MGIIDWTEGIFFRRQKYDLESFAMSKLANIHGLISQDSLADGSHQSLTDGERIEPTSQRSYPLTITQIHLSNHHSLADGPQHPSTDGKIAENHSSSPQGLADNPHHPGTHDESVELTQQGDRTGIARNSTVDISLRGHSLPPSYIHNTPEPDATDNHEIPTELNSAIELHDSGIALCAREGYEKGLSSLLGAVEWARLDYSLSPSPSPEMRARLETWLHDYGQCLLDAGRRNEARDVYEEEEQLATQAGLGYNVEKKIQVRCTLLMNYL